MLISTTQEYQDVHTSPRITQNLPNVLKTLSKFPIVALLMKLDKAHLAMTSSNLLEVRTPVQQDNREGSRQSSICNSPGWDDENSKRLKREKRQAKTKRTSEKHRTERISKEKQPTKRLSKAPPSRKEQLSNAHLENSSPSAELKNILPQPNVHYGGEGGPSRSRGAVVDLSMKSVFRAAQFLPTPWRRAQKETRVSVDGGGFIGGRKLVLARTGAPEESVADCHSVAGPLESGTDAGTRDIVSMQRNTGSHFQDPSSNSRSTNSTKMTRPKDLESNNAIARSTEIISVISPSCKRETSKLTAEDSDQFEWPLVIDSRRSPHAVATRTQLDRRASGEDKYFRSQPQMRPELAMLGLQREMRGAEGIPKAAIQPDVVLDRSTSLHNRSPHQHLGNLGVHSSGLQLANREAECAFEHEDMCITSPRDPQRVMSRSCHQTFKPTEEKSHRRATSRLSWSETSPKLLKNASKLTILKHPGAAHENGATVSSEEYCTLDESSNITTPQEISRPHSRRSSLVPMGQVNADAIPATSMQQPPEDSWAVECSSTDSRKHGSGIEHQSFRSTHHDNKRNSHASELGSGHMPCDVLLSIPPHPRQQNGFAVANETAASDRTAFDAMRLHGSSPSSMMKPKHSEESPLPGRGLKSFVHPAPHEVRTFTTEEAFDGNMIGRDRKYTNLTSTASSGSVPESRTRRLRRSGKDGLHGFSRNVNLHNESNTTGIFDLKKPVAKIFVLCCSCGYFQDIPSKIYEYMVQPGKVIADETLGVSGLVNNSIACPWCRHGMSTSCCAGYSSVVYLGEKLH